jgi:hypothetical protein
MPDLRVASLCLAIASLVFLAGAIPIAEREAQSVSTDFKLHRRQPAFYGLQGDALLQWTENNRAMLRTKYASKLRASSNSHAEKRRVQKRDTASGVQLVNYQHDSTFYAPVTIGTPGQQVYMVLDTGSSDMWTVQGKRDWNPASSSTFQNSSNAFHITYGSGEVSGTLATDTVTLAGHTSSDQTFAIATSISSGLLGDSVEGIMGFGFESLSTSKSQPFWAASGANEFSFYLAADSSQDSTEVGSGSYMQVSDEQSGGTFTLGGRNTSLYQGDINWSDVVDESYWLITLGGITANGNTVDLSGLNKVAVDTGTTLIGAPDSIVQEIYSGLTGSERLSSGYYTFPCSETNLSATLHFGNQEYTLSANDLIAGTTDTSGQTCLGSFFDIGSSSEDELQYILGDAFLMNVYTIFSNSASSSTARVGFASLADGLGSTTTSTTVNQVVAANSAPRRIFHTISATLLASTTITVLLLLA